MIETNNDLFDVGYRSVVLAMVGVTAGCHRCLIRSSSSPLDVNFSNVSKLQEQERSFHDFVKSIHQIHDFAHFFPPTTRLFDYFMGDLNIQGNVKI